MSRLTPAEQKRLRRLSEQMDAPPEHLPRVNWGLLAFLALVAGGYLVLVAGGYLVLVIELASRHRP